MRKFLCCCSVLLLCNLLHGQNNWFNLYTDSVALVADANEISDRFISDVFNIKPDLQFNPNTILNTQPWLVFYLQSDNTVNLPLWSQVEDFEFFTAVAGSEADGKAFFGAFFNGFYLAHELGHALQYAATDSLEGSYENEYFANVVAMQFWRHTGYQDQLEICYQYAKKASAALPDPVPAGTSVQDYFTENYFQLVSDPFIYGYMQMNQFIEIYEAGELPEFKMFVKKYLKVD